MPRQIVINQCYGGFNLSEQVKTLYRQYTADIPRPAHWYIDADVCRDDECLLRIIKDVGLDAAGGQFSKLKIVEIPDDVDWEIKEYDGVEWVAEKHRTWS
jgi:hypothetical protein